MITLCLLYQYQNQGTTVKAAFPRDLEAYRDMIGNEKKNTLKYDKNPRMLL